MCLQSRGKVERLLGVTTHLIPWEGSSSAREQMRTATAAYTESPAQQLVGDEVQHGPLECALPTIPA